MSTKLDSWRIRETAPWLQTNQKHVWIFNSVFESQTIEVWLNFTFSPLVQVET